MKTKNTYIILLMIILAIALVFLRGDEDTWVCENGVAVKHGNPSKPAPVDLCSDNTEKSNLIQLDYPKESQVIESPLIVKGKARGTWFFEASFPIILTDWDGRIIAESYVTAKTDWMTEDFIEFEGVLEFEKPENIGDFSRTGSLILKKDNPSGLPELDDALEIQIKFW